MFRRPLCFIRSLVAQDINAFRRSEFEHTAGKVRLGVQTAEADAGLVAEAVFQLHGGEVFAFKADADVLVAGVVFLRRSQNIVDTIGRTIFFQRVAAVQCRFVGEDGGRAVADGLVL